MTNFILSCITAASVWGQPLEVKFQPDSVVYVYETAGPISARKLFTGLIQNMAFVNRSNETIILTNGTIRSIKAGQEIQSKLISREAMVSSAKRFRAMQMAGLLELYDFQFQTLQFLAGVKFAASDTLRPGEGLMITHQALLFDDLPEELIISIQGKTIKQKQVSSSNRMKVVNHMSKNTYTFPLKGRWVAAAAPSLISHHRWASIQEFAYDFIQLGNDNYTYKNDGTKLTDYYAYGKPIYSVGDGTVISVLDSISDSDDQLKRPGEAENAFLQRVAENQQQLLIKGFKYIMGNHVVVKHSNGEYSFYLHLKKGSVKVKRGDVVNGGGMLAELGSSGNSTEPHLHFHITNGPDFSHSRSLPIRFSNIQLYPDDNGSISHIHSGQILATK